MGNILKSVRWRMAQLGEKRFWKKWLKTNSNDDEWLSLVIEYFKLHKGEDFGKKTCVDIGSGPIGILTKLKAKKKIAVDPLPIDSLDSSIERIKSPGEDIPLKDKIADIVFIYNVLQHVQSPTGVLDEAKRLLKKGGRFYLLEQLNYPTNNTHPNCLRLKMFDDWIMKNNFTIIKRLVEDDHCLEIPQHVEGSGYQVLCFIIEKN